jgi:hypothetical protein
MTQTRFALHRTAFDLFSSMAQQILENDSLHSRGYNCGYRSKTRAPFSSNFIALTDYYEDRRGHQNRTVRGTVVDFGDSAFTSEPTQWRC